MEAWPCPLLHSGEGSPCPRVPGWQGPQAPTLVTLRPEAGERDILPLFNTQRDLDATPTPTWQPHSHRQVQPSCAQEQTIGRSLPPPGLGCWEHCCLLAESTSRSRLGHSWQLGGELLQQLSMRAHLGCAPPGCPAGAAGSSRRVGVGRGLCFVSTHHHPCAPFCG